MPRLNMAGRSFVRKLLLGLSAAFAAVSLGFAVSWSRSELGSALLPAMYILGLMLFVSVTWLLHPFEKQIWSKVSLLEYGVILMMFLAALLCWVLGAFAVGPIDVATFSSLLMATLAVACCILLRHLPRVRSFNA